MNKKNKQSSKTNKSQKSQFASNMSADLKNADCRNNDKSSANSNFTSKTNRTDCK